MEKPIKTILSDSGMFSIIINRPDKRNAVNYEVMDGLERSLEIAENNTSIKTVMISGEGNQAFCSGGDLKEFHDLQTEKQAYGMLSRMGRILYRLLTLRKPTIAYINGTAIGGGCELASACDIRLASSSAKIGFIQGTLGITTGWGGASILYEKLPVKSALTFLLGSEMHSAEKAKKLGFIDYIVPSTESEEWDSFQKQLLKKELGVLTAYKSLLVKKWEDSGISDRIFEEITQCSRLWETEEHHAEVRKFMDRK